MKHDRAAELRAIADGRLMLNVRNGVTVARSMLARIADEFETMSTAIAAKDAELAAVHQRYVDANEARIDAEAQLAERAGGVNEDALRALAQAYDREDAAQHGEPDPWNLDDPGDIGDSDTWVSERIACARAAADALLSALEPAAPEGHKTASAASVDPDGIWERAYAETAGVQPDDETNQALDTSGGRT